MARPRGLTPGMVSCRSLTIAIPEKSFRESRQRLQAPLKLSSLGMVLKSTAAWAMTVRILGTDNALV